MGKVDCLIWNSGFAWDRKKACDISVDNYLSQEAGRVISAFVYLIVFNMYKYIPLCNILNRYSLIYNTISQCVSIITRSYQIKKMVFEPFFTLIHSRFFCVAF